MKFSFTAEIYKVGINPCVDVPLKITSKMIATKGYIQVKGTIGGHAFKQTLVPVKDAEYRLYVNGPMLKGSDTKVGDKARFVIEEDPEDREKDYPMPKLFSDKLKETDLLKVFEELTPYRRKEILKYLNYLKTEEALSRNIEKLITQFRKQ